MNHATDEAAHPDTRRDRHGIRLTSRHWIGLIALVVLISVVSAIGWTSDVAKWLDPKKITTFLEELGPIAPVVYMLIMVAAVVISPIPSLPLDAAAGAVFGPFLGTAYSVIGAEAGAIISFFLARLLGRKAIARLFRTDIGFCDLCTERRLFIIILLSRLFPFFSFDLISYGAGLSRISTRGFAVATLIGMIPPTFALNYFGSGIFSGSAYTLMLAGIVVVAFLLIPRWIKESNPWGLYDRLEVHRHTQVQSAAPQPSRAATSSRETNETSGNEGQS